MAVTVDQLFAALAHGQDEVVDLQRRFLDQKLRVYRETLSVLADLHGVQLASTSTSRRVYRALRRESLTQAQRVIDTYNRELRAFIAHAAAGGASGVEVVDMVEEWTISRAERRAEMVAVTEAYGPHVDALVSFYAEAAGTPLFDFGGHGDAPPACDVCAAIIAGNPWPLEDVRRIGIPHIACRQDWHAVGDVQLPEEVDVGQVIAGIVGSDTLVHRSADRHEAVATIEALARGEDA